MLIAEKAVAVRKNREAKMKENGISERPVIRSISAPASAVLNAPRKLKKIESPKNDKLETSMNIIDTPTISRLAATKGRKPTFLSGRPCRLDAVKLPISSVNRGMRPTSSHV